MHSSVALHAGIAQHKLLRCLLTLAGFTTVLAISFHVLGFIPMHYSVPLLVLPVILTEICIGVLLPRLGRLMLMGWLFGVAAVALYDISRVPFMLAGWSDFVPRVGCWVFQDETTPGIVGYLYRYIGNGGGMGMSFILLVNMLHIKKNLVIKGIVYGLFINANLLLTLLVAPDGEELMFALTPLNCFGSFIGHLVYGSALGYLTKNFLREYFSN